MARALKAGEVIEVTLTDKKGNRGLSQKAVVQNRITPKPVIEKLRQGDMIITGKIAKDSTVTVKLNSEIIPIERLNISGENISIKAPKGHFALNDKIEIITKRKDCLQSSTTSVAQYDRQDDFVLLNLADKVKEGDSVTVIQGEFTIGSKIINFGDILSKLVKVNLARPLDKSEKTNIIFKDDIQNSVSSFEFRLV